MITSENTPKRIWLDWTQPCLPAAAERLVDRYASIDGSLAAVDMQSSLCVLPGRRAGRTLLELMIRFAHERGQELIPPRIITPGLMVDEMTDFDGPCASGLERRLAWTEALRTVPHQIILPLIPELPDHDAQWRSLAGLISRLHDELAGELKSFPEVAEQAERMELFGEADRWHALHQVYQHYLTVLEEAGLHDSHQARRDALQQGSVDEELDLILIGVVELNATQRRVIELLSKRTRVFIHAPEASADRFDSLGCVHTSTWFDAQIDIPDKSVRVADRPADQAQMVIHAIFEDAESRPNRQITIGLADETLATTVQRAAQWASIPVHSALGLKLSDSAPYRLLKLMVDWLTEPRFATFAELLRHPDFESWLLQSSDLSSDDSSTKAVGDWLTLLDKYFTDHLHERFFGQWLGEPDRRQRLAEIYDRVNGLLSPLMGSDQPAGYWCERAVEVLQTIYSQPVGNAEEIENLTEACETLCNAFSTLIHATPALQPVSSAASALSLALSEAAEAQFADPMRTGQVEMLGWLELHLDTAETLIVCGFNDGAVPASRHADAFLPDSLRSRLGLADNTRRVARDAYLLQAILLSRPQTILIAGRSREDGDTLMPSPLLLSCDDDELIKRLRLFCDDDPSSNVAPLPIGLPAAGKKSRFTIPALPSDLPLPEYLNVTDFRLYIHCPYRFVLKRILKLQPVSDGDMELSAAAFGSLAHDVLNTFGRNPVRDSQDPTVISKFLIHCLHQVAMTRFGDAPLPAVQVQLARLEQRFRDFAVKQSELRCDGWQIQHTELTLNNAVKLEIPDQNPMPIRARIDRIDFHPDLKKWRIIDYKTSETEKTPHQIHHGSTGASDEWLDLQLPLYHHLTPQCIAELDKDTIELGYIVLPKRSEGTQYFAGNWTHEQLDGAIDYAREIVLKIRNKQFEMNQESGMWFDDYARICQTTSIAATVENEEAES